MTPPTNASELRALADRCEQVSGGDRELDARIWCAINGKRYVGHHPAYSAFGLGNPETQVEFTTPPKRTRLVSVSSNQAKPWTASLDAAIALVPAWDEWRRIEFSITDGGESDPYWFVTLRWVPRAAVSGERRGHGVAATPALALTAACLRARAAMMETPHDL